MAKTPEEKWKEAVSMYKKQCQNIMNLSDSIRYTGAINAYGRTLAGVVKPGLRPLLKSEHVKNEFFVISTLMSLRKKTSSTVGKLEHVVLQHTKVTIIIIQQTDITFYVSINKKEKDLGTVIRLIKKTLASSKRA